MKLVLQTEADPEKLTNVIKMARTSRSETKIELLSPPIFHFPCLGNNPNVTFCCHYHLKVLQDETGCMLHETISANAATHHRGR